MKIGKLINTQTMLATPGNPTDPDIVIAESLDLAKYNDITSITSWHSYGRWSKDYLYIRQQIAIIAATTGFSNLTSYEKDLASTYFTVTKTDRDTIHSDTDQQANWSVFVNRAAQCRQQRWEAAKSYISFVLSMPDSIDLGKTADTHSHEYLIYGVEDNISDGVDGLFDYLEGTSSFIGGGYPTKVYWTQIDQDKIMDILRNGNY